MICMSARDVVESTGAMLLVEGKRPLAGEVEIDSRRVGEGSLLLHLRARRSTETPI